MFPLCLLFVSAFCGKTPSSGDRVETKRKHVSTLSPLPEASKNSFEVLRLGSETLGRGVREYPTGPSWLPGKAWHTRGTVPTEGMSCDARVVRILMFTTMTGQACPETYRYHQQRPCSSRNMTDIDVSHRAVATV